MNDVSSLPAATTPVASLPEPDLQELLGMGANAASPSLTPPAPPVTPPAPPAPAPTPAPTPSPASGLRLGQETPLVATPVPGMPAPAPMPPPAPPTPPAANPPTPPKIVPTPSRPAAPPAAPTPDSPPIVSRVVAQASQVSALPFVPTTTVAAPTAASAPPAAPQPVKAAPAVPTEPAPGQPKAVASPPTINTPPSSAAASVPKPKGKAKSLPKWLLALAGLVVVLVIALVGYFALQSRSAPSVKPSTSAPAATKSIELTYWGLWEPSEVMQPLISEYERDHAGVKIAYTQQKGDQYRQRLQAAIRDGSGPDIFRYHNTWMPMLRGDLAPAPKTILSAEQVQAAYYPVIQRDLIINREVMGVPLMFDGLALLYNRDMLEAANETAPKDWESVRALASRLAVRTGDRLERGGIAMGTTGNVDHFSDILGLLLLQGSADPAQPSSTNAQQALEFYTIFARTDKVWDDTMPNSVSAFATEKVAMIIAPSWRIHDIQKLNPNLRIGVSEVPQLGGQPITWATYWTEGVSKSSTQASEAWKFLAWLSQPEQLRKLSTEARAYRGFGELYPRADMASELASDPLVAPYIADALSAQSWYLASMTHDEGINDQLIQYYADAVNQLNQRGNSQAALDAILPGIQQVLTRYAVVQGPALGQP